MKWAIIRALLIISGFFGIAAGVYMFFVPISSEPADSELEAGSDQLRTVIMIWMFRIMFIGGGLGNSLVGIFSSDEALKRRFTPFHLRD